jgi:hypothetical protein
MSNLLTPAEVSERYRNKIKVKTLANWRSNGEGPKYVKIGGAVLYPVEELVQWERKRIISHV